MILMFFFWIKKGHFSTLNVSFMLAPFVGEKKTKQRRENYMLYIYIVVCICSTLYRMKENPVKINNKNIYTRKEKLNAPFVFDVWNGSVTDSLLWKICDVVVLLIVKKINKRKRKKTHKDF